MLIIMVYLIFYGLPEVLLRLSGLPEYWNMKIESNIVFKKADMSGCMCECILLTTKVQISLMH